MEKKKEAAGDVRFHLETGGLFKGISSLLDLASKLAEQGGSAVTREGEIEGLKNLEGAKGVFGFSVRVGGLGEGLRVEPFGNIRETESGPVVEEIREPLVDIFEEEKEISMVAELPGVEESGIEIGIEGDTLTLKAGNGGRKYSRRVKLPSPVDASKMTSAYKNGVLEIHIPKAG